LRCVLKISGSADQRWMALPRRSRGQTRTTTRGASTTSQPQKGNWRVPCSCLLCWNTRGCLQAFQHVHRSSILCGCINKFLYRQANAVWGRCPTAYRLAPSYRAMSEAVGTEQHSSTAQHSSTWEGGLRRCISTGSDERRQWRLVAEGRQVNGHMKYQNFFSPPPLNTKKWIRSGGAVRKGNRETRTPLDQTTSRLPQQHVHPGLGNSPTPVTLALYVLCYSHQQLRGS
jgi:hypothetical protein